jgi:transcription elongation factor GreA
VRIIELESKLANSIIISPDELNKDGKCVFGTYVEVLNLSNDQKFTYQIVGEDEADVKIGKISFASPLSRALIGKVAGDIAEFESPNGVQEYEIITVKYSL